MSPLSPWKLERLHADDLTPAEQKSWGAESCTPENAAELQRLESDDAAFFAVYPAEEQLPLIRRRFQREEAATPPGPARARTAWRWAFAVPALCAWLFWAVSPHSASHLPEVEESTRVKGSAHLRVFQKEGSGSVELFDGDRVEAGAEIQLRYVPGGKKFGVIVSLDGGGGVTRHSPLRGEDSALVSWKETTLPRAFRLDQAPKFERFIFLTSDQPVPLEEALSAARQLAHTPEAATAPLNLPRSISQFSLLLRKDRSP